jgi:putative peptidoglycan lipid II flippase
VTLFINPVWAIGIMAMGQTVGNVVSSGVGLFLLRRRVGPLGLASGLVTASRVGVAAAVAGLVAWGVTLVLHPITGAAIDSSSSALKRMFASALEIGLVGLVFGVIYLGIAHALHVREVRQVADLVRQRLGR